MQERTYENDEDYILDILKQEEDRLMEEINDNLSSVFKFEFSKFLAVRNAIENINIKNAVERGLYNKVV